MLTDQKDRRTLARGIASAFIERSKALEYKGKKRDNAALDYFIGAAKCLELTGDEETASYLGRLAWLISVRGYSEVETIAEIPEPTTETA